LDFGFDFSIYESLVVWLLSIGELLDFNYYLIWYYTFFDLCVKGGAFDLGFTSLGFDFSIYESSVVWLLSIGELLNFKYRLIWYYTFFDLCMKAGPFDFGV